MRRSCGRASDWLNHPSSTRRVVVAGCADLAAAYKVDVKEQFCLIPNTTCKSRWRLKGVFGFALGCLTASVTCWWAGVDNADCTEKCPGVESSHFGRRLPPVKCTLCWVRLIQTSFSKLPIDHNLHAAQMGNVA